MSLYTSVQDGVRNITLVALSEYPSPVVIFSHSGGAEPPSSYVAISVLSLNQLGSGTSSTLTNVGEELSICATYEAMIQLSFVGSIGGDMAYSFNQRIKNNPLVLEECNRNKLGLMRNSQVRRAPQKRDTQWIDNHNIDLTFSYSVTTQQVVGVVDAVLLQDELTLTQIVIPTDFVIT